MPLFTKLLERIRIDDRHDLREVQKYASDDVYPGIPQFSALQCLLCFDAYPTDFE